ncbi:MAG: hypothetical protein RLZ75_736 [Pseudomonadota bacterium]|jgi:hypothetical protein
MELILTHKAEILGLALAISELLALIPSVKSNSIFTLVVNLFKKFLA